MTSSEVSAGAATEEHLRALLDGDACVDLGDHDVLVLRGEDVLSYLHTKLTAHVPRLVTRGGGPTTATDINGRLVFCAQMLSREGDVWLVLPPGTAAAARAHLERFVIMEDVEIETCSGDLHPVVVVGSEAARREASASLSGPRSDALAPWPDLRFFGRDADWVLLPRAQAQQAIEALPAHLPVIGPALRERASLLMDSPQLGLDLVVGETLPIEAGLWEAISFNKGCYLGQEVIERLFARGRPNKRLMRVRIPGPPPAAGTPLAGTPKPAGHITRATVNLEGETIAFAFIRRRYLDDPQAMQAGEGGPEIEVLAYVGGEAPADGGRS